MGIRNSQDGSTEKSNLQAKGTSARGAADAVKRKRKSKKPVLFVYATPENKKCIDELVEKHNEQISNVINNMIEGYRTGKKVTFETVVPKYVKLADAWKKKFS